MYDTVLIPTDGSAGTSRVLDHGLELARRYDASVHGLYVVDRRQFIGADEDVQADIADELRTEGEAAVARVAERAAEAEVEVETTVIEGVPDKTIVSYVDEHDVDVVVMGTHGRTGKDKLAHLGGVTEWVVKHAPVPVLVIDLRED